ncbi:LacI family transcriptional regulator [Polaribacter reichenbachii]|uniref:LacI family transcriptional regulator n=1 Tax=Polaribacter reichenbachii TaxID=996801 RepID=A0A1B8TVI3_9FLAO|nr:LacI family DNA-binding transcriptional regulator [Polaribacter reichenbachii]APZ45420.1 LacI family transcriptional regulator [Polaribacter reichenbachii]AUC19281.1 LacI family transcriptional regulator [Polaribacter reichenbachii]OBY63564.1 LacI family transcriptional regulator [Polaribacter reichenbachii]
MPKKPTIYDIAERLNITAATVSRALNNNPKISKPTRELVIKTAAEMGYEQNKLAQALKSGKSHNVGVIVPRIDNNFFASVIRGIEEELYPKGYHVIICQTHNKEDLEIRNINSLLNAQVDGILMSISNAKIEEKEGFKNLLKKSIPLIFFDRKRDIQDVSTVTIDDFRGAYESTQHLINQGCKRIAHLSNDRLFLIYKNRYLGYKQAIIDNGLEFDENLVIEIESKISEGKRITKELLALENPADGIFSSSDFTALGAIEEIKSQGLKIPENIAVVGFSNEPFTKFMELSITTVDQSPVEMGRIAAQVFLEEITNSKKVKSKKEVILSPELIVRKSSMKLENKFI